MAERPASDRGEDGKGRAVSAFRTAKEGEVSAPVLLCASVMHPSPSCRKHFNRLADGQAAFASPADCVKRGSHVVLIFSFLVSRAR